MLQLSINSNAPSEEQDEEEEEEEGVNYFFSDGISDTSNHPQLNIIKIMLLQLSKFKCTIGRRRKLEKGEKEIEEEDKEEEVEEKEEEEEEEKKNA